MTKWSMHWWHTPALSTVIAPFRMGLLQTLAIVLVAAKSAPQALGATATMAAAHITESVENFLDVQKQHIMRWYPSRKDAIVGMTHAAEMIQRASTVQETGDRAFFAKSTLYVALEMAHKQMPHRVSADHRTMGKHAHRTNCSVKN